MAVEAYVPCNLYRPVDQLFALARPGYKSYSRWEPLSKAERAEIAATVQYLDSHGVGLIISLSSTSFAQSHDPLIKESFSGKFLHVPAEDPFGVDDDYEEGSGITVDKLRTCVRAAVECLTFTPTAVSEPLHTGVAVYCGEGIGRSGAVLAAIIATLFNASVPTAIARVADTMKMWSVTKESTGKVVSDDDISEEFSKNGAREALQVLDAQKRTSLPGVFHDKLRAPPLYYWIDPARVAAFAAYHG